MLSLSTLQGMELNHKTIVASMKAKIFTVAKIRGYVAI
jgi:hypothetical protein